MSILSLSYVGSLADGKQAPGSGVLDRLFTALYRARMAQAERVIAQYCPVGLACRVPPASDPAPDDTGSGRWGD